MPRDLKSALLAGIASSGLFIAVFGIGLGFLFMFLPALPLFYVGLGLRVRTARDASLIASCIIGLLSGPSAVVVYLFFLGLPAVHLCYRAMLVGREGGQLHWYPMGQVMLNLALWGCGMITLITAYYWGQDGGLPAILADTIREAFTGLQEEYGDVIEAMANNWSFLIFPVTLWLWCMLLYLHAWIATWMLTRNGLARRPSLAVTPFSMPSWMLSLVAICALASLIGSDSMRFLGKACLVSLMLPYFFLGVAYLKSSTAHWPNHRFFLFFIYFLVFTQFWPALIVSGVGLWFQIKGLSQQETSTRK